MREAKSSTTTHSGNVPQQLPPATGSSGAQAGAQIWPRRWHKENQGTAANKNYKKVAQVDHLLKTLLQGRLHPSCQIFLPDAEYYLTPKADADYIIRQSAVDRKQYAPQGFDCDDFALVLKSHFAQANYKDGNRRTPHCFGIVFGTFNLRIAGRYQPVQHAMNWMLNEDEQLRFIEPQWDKEYPLAPQDGGFYYLYA